MKKLTSIVVVIFLISILKAFSYGQGDSAAVNRNHPPIERDEQLSRRFPHSKNEMDFTEKRDILSERMEHHKGERAGAQKQSLSNDKEPEWVSHYALGLALAYDVATDMAVDNIGNVYVTGYSPELPFGVDYFTAKYDASGNQIWAVRYDNSGDDLAYAIAVDGSGNVYVTGESYNSDLEIENDWDYATVKYNSKGEEQWVARYNGLGNDWDWATAIAVDGSGNVYVTGGSYGSDTYYDYATVKYNSEGQEQWVARYNEPRNAWDEANAIVIDGSGNVYVTGESCGSAGSSDYATVKYNSSGEEQWVARYDGMEHIDYAYAIAVDGSGNVYVTGFSYGGSGTDHDYATVKYNSEGEEEWVARYNGPGNSGDYANAIAVDGSGNVYVTGESYGSGSSFDYMTVKYNSEGEEQWVARYDGPGNSSDEAHAIAVDGSGNVYVTGYSKGSDTYYDYATVKYNSSGQEQWVARYDGPGNDDDYASAIAVDGSGNVYVTGGSEGSGTSSDYATVKYNSSGEEQWVARYNGPGNGNDYANAIAVDGSGNIYVTGRSYNSDSDIEDDWDYATVKYNSEGQEQWVARYDGPENSYDKATAIAVDGSGNVYVTGYSKGSDTYYDYATVKYNSSGEEQWVARYNGPGNYYDYAHAIAIDGSGNVYVTGESRGSGTFDDYATVKYNSSGQEQWVARYNGPGNSGDGANAIAVDGSGNIYVTGSSYNLDLDIKDDWDYATVKYNSEGQEQWVARYNGPGNSSDEANAIAVDGSGNVYVTGSSVGSGTSFDYMTVKYNSEGQEQWVARYNGPGNGNDYANAIAVDGSGNIYVTGESYDSGTSSDYATVKYNSSGEEQWVARYNGPENSVDRAHAIAIDGSDVYVSGVSAGLGTSYDYATVKYNSAGEEQWVARYNGPGNSYDYVTAIAVDGSGNVYVTGYSEGNKWSVYTTIKYSGETGIVDEIINLPSTVYLGNNYPNPFNSSTTIQYTLPRNEYVRLSIYSISGQLVKTIENGVRSVGVHTESWNGTDARGRSATSGIYFYRLEAGGETFVKKMVLMR